MYIVRVFLEILLRMYSCSDFVSVTYVIPAVAVPRPPSYNGLDCFRKLFSALSFLPPLSSQPAVEQCTYIFAAQLWLNLEACQKPSSRYSFLWHQS
jgi:hypothetical protein